MYKDGPEFGGGSDPAMGELDPSVVTLVGDQQPDAQEASPETGDQIPAYTAAEQLSSPEDGEQSRDRASARLLGRVANIAGRLAEGINNRRTLSEVASDTKEAFGARVNGASDRIKSIAQTSLDVTKDIAIGVGVEAVYLVTEPVKVLGKSVIRAGIGVGRQAAKAADSMYSGLDKMGSSIDAKMFATEEAMKNGVESTRTFFKDKAEAAKTRKEERSDRVALKRIARGEKISENIAALKYQVNETISARQDARTESDREQDLRKAGLQVSETDQQQEASDGQSEQTESVVPEGDVASLANQSVGEVQEETPIGRQTREALKARAEAARRSREASAEGGTTTTEAPEELALAA